MQKDSFWATYFLGTYPWVPCSAFFRVSPISFLTNSAGKLSHVFHLAYSFLTPYNFCHFHIHPKSFLFHGNIPLLIIFTSSSSVSVISTRSSAYNSSNSKRPLHFRDRASSAMMNCKGLSAEPSCTPTFTQKPHSAINVHRCCRFFIRGLYCWQYAFINS